MSCTPEEVSAIKDHLSSMGEQGIAGSLNPDNAVTALIAHHRGVMSKHKATLGLSADAPFTAIEPAIVSLKTDLDTAKTELNTAKTEATANADKVLKLSADAPRKPDPITLAMYGENMAAKRESVIRAGVVSEAQAKVFDRLVLNAQGQPNALALSACDDTKRPLGFELWDALAQLDDKAGIRAGNTVPRDSKPVDLRLSAEGDENKPMTEERRKELLGSIDLAPIPAKK